MWFHLNYVTHTSSLYVCSRTYIIRAYLNEKQCYADLSIDDSLKMNFVKLYLILVNLFCHREQFSCSETDIRKNVFMLKYLPG